MTLRPARLLAGSLITLAVTAAPAAATEVSVRIAGETAAAQLGPVTVDTQPTGTFGPDNCPNDSAGGAVDVAVKQNWDRKQFTSTILGETHTFTRNDSWTFWINDTVAQVGLCGYVPKAGDRILVVASTSDPVTFAPTPTPLTFRGVPSDAVAGEPFEITVVAHTSPDGITTTTTPVAGARVEAGDVTATTGADGKATITIDEPGRVQVVATRQGNVSTDPLQLSIAPAEDSVAPTVSIGNIRKGERFTPRTAPRRVRGEAGDEGPIRRVSLSVLRKSDGACARLTQRSRFKRTSCDRPGDLVVVPRGNGSWSMPLPKVLAPGRYTVRAEAIDAAGNRSGVRTVRFRVVR